MSQAQTPQPKQAQGDAPPHRYNAALAQAIESRWQTFWREHKTFHTPNPGEPGFDSARPKQYVLDMFPYPSGVGLHVGHPLGYIATDIYARYLRMAGYNVLHTMGFDSFGLPAEQFALQTGTHPRVSTEANIATMRAQLTRLGLGHDPHRSVSTTDPEFYKWTQWIFLQIYNSWYDGNALGGKARPISELVKVLESGRVKSASGRAWSSLNKDEQRAEIDSRRLAFLAEVPVNWCPMLGTVLANEEVTAEGRSERGNFPVYKRPLRQWMMRITAYAERLLNDLEKVDWPEPIKLMQRNWIGRSEGAWVDFPVSGTQSIRVFTTRPDTIFGATYMVLSPEHPMVGELTPEAWDTNKKGHIPPQWRGSFPGAPAFGYQTPREAVEGYRAYARARTDEQRTEGKVKTGVFTGAYATNPATGAEIPIFIADYVLMGYGTGAIMAVPAHDERDFEFARTMDLPIRDVVYPRHVLAIRHFAQEVHPAGSTSTPDWRNELADFLGLVTKSSPDASFDELLRVVRERRAPQQEPKDGPRGATRAEWLEAIDDLRVKSLDDLRALFADAGYYAQSGFPYAGPGTAANSAGPHFTLTGLHTPEAKKVACEAIEKQGLGQAAVTYKLRDWLFSRQRYWGEPFPIVYDEEGHAHAVPESMLPVLLPELANFHPETSEDPNAPVVTPLNRAKEWVTATLDLGDGKGPQKYRRETNTMPNWAGSCWYYLRYLDPADAKSFCDPKVEKYWMSGDAGAERSPRSEAPGTRIGGVDLYVGGVEHAVLHLLYARFWHKVLFDLGYVSTPEPFQKLFNQGYIQAAAYTDSRGMYVPAAEVTEREEVSVEVDDLNLSSGEVEPIKRSTRFFYKEQPVFYEYGKMGKALKNAVAPDDVFVEFGCDTMRLYEMAMGPLEASKPWNTRDIAGSHRFLQRVWRNLIDENTGLSRCVTTPADRATLRILHKTIIGVRRDMESLGFNTVVSKLIELNNHLATLPAVPLEVAAPLILMLTPMAPHTGEELWHRVMRAPKHPEAAPTSIIHERFPIADEKLAADDHVEIPVSINGKLRSKVSVPAGADAAAIEAAAKSDPRVIELIEGKAIKKTIVVPGRMVNFVV